MTDAERIADLEAEREKDQRTIEELVEAERAADDALEAAKERLASSEQHTALDAECFDGIRRQARRIGIERSYIDDVVGCIVDRCEELTEERDEAKNLLAAANERAERAERYPERLASIERERAQASESRVAELEKQNEKLQRHPECLACGMVGTREAVLTHIPDCEKHPIHALKSRLSASEARCKEMEGALRGAVKELEWWGDRFHYDLPDASDHYVSALLAARAVLAQQGQDAAPVQSPACVNCTTLSEAVVSALRFLRGDNPNIEAAWQALHGAYLLLPSSTPALPEEIGTEEGS